MYVRKTTTIEQILRLPDNPASKGIWVDLDLYAVRVLCVTDIEGR